MVQLAEEIAKAKIPLIFTATRPGPDSWTKKDSPPGPPLGRSPADILTEAGVFYAVAINTDGGKSRISLCPCPRHTLAHLGCVLLINVLLFTPNRPAGGRAHPVAGAGGLVGGQVRGSV